jgi:hypothetical protein
LISKKEGFSKYSFVPPIHKAKAEKPKAEKTSEKIKPSPTDPEVTDPRQTGGQPTNTTSILVPGDVLLVLKTAKEVEKKGTASPVIVPTPGNITTPSPIKSLKTPPSNTNVKKPPAATKTFVPNQFDQEWIQENCCCG